MCVFKYVHARACVCVWEGEEGFCSTYIFGEGTADISRSYVTSSGKKGTFVQI